MERYLFSQITENGDFVKVLVKCTTNDIPEFDGYIIRLNQADNLFLLSDCRKYAGGWGISMVDRANRFTGTHHKYLWCINNGASYDDTLNTFNAMTFTARTVSDILLTQETDSENDNIDSMITEFINDNYYADILYDGMGEYHEMDFSYLNKPKKQDSRYLVGVEIETEFRSQDKLDDFKDIPSNWFYREEDGSLNSYGCEIITIPLLPNDAKSPSTWEPLRAALSGNALSWDSCRCGLHIHFSKSILIRNGKDYDTNLAKLLFLYHHHVKDTSYNVAVFGRSRGYCNESGKCESADNALFLGTDALKMKCVKDRVSADLINKAGRTRYYDINVNPRDTIEFRKGRGTFNPVRIASIVEYCELMCKYAISHKWEDLSSRGFLLFLRKYAKNEILKRVVNSY